MRTTATLLAKLLTGLLLVGAALAISGTAASAQPGKHDACPAGHDDPVLDENGANVSGPYNSTCDGSPSMNGNGNGNAKGRPCAGCVGKADDKNPPGQLPNAAEDGNNGYECDGNKGVGKTNPAHTGCVTTPPTS